MILLTIVEMLFCFHFSSIVVFKISLTKIWKQKIKSKYGNIFLFIYEKHEMSAKIVFPKPNMLFCCWICKYLYFLTPLPSSE